MTRALPLLLAVLLAACAAVPVVSPPPTPTSPVGGPSPSTQSPAPATPSPSVPPLRSASPPPVATPVLSPSGTAGTLLGSPSASPTNPATPPGDFDPTGLTVEFAPFATGLDEPVFATGTADGTGRLFVVEQPGRIHIVNSDGSVAPSPFLDISAEVQFGGEQGLLGLALHPDYARNGRLFVDYTRQGDGATVISEFRASGDTADPASERVLLTIPQPFVNHNGGMLGFDTGGKLLIGMGDGGSGGDPQGNGQNRQALLGKILRIDVDGKKPYAIPSDNPFAGSKDAAPEIWDLGTRNPWRFSFDRKTGDLFIGDVGQGDWEEIDAEPAGTGGRNYGWNVMEGDHCFRVPDCDQSGVVRPVVEYSHDDGSCSVIGGYVYRGSALPGLQGGYIFSDYCSGTLWAFSAAAALATGSVPLTVVGSAGQSPSSFGQDDAGELYLMGSSGRILKVAVATR
jgi:glucose/arabinose dehydrogenase